MDTIFALASARGKAGIAVIRISGPQAFAACEMLCGVVPAPRAASLRTLTWGGEFIDQALVLVFEKGRSFTGEASVELHLHGSHAVVQAVLRILSEQDGFRLADPGEFTRRALENGQLDLTQVEGLADLIDAETEIQRKQALKVLSGSVAQKAEGWRQKLIRSGALIEATIDFADEDVPVDVSPEVLSLIDSLIQELGREVAGSRSAERVRDGFEVVILGAPNAGKSTLLNALAGREAAITSDIAGTTRDIVEVRFDLGGMAVTFLDTAGLRLTDDVLEKMGIERALSRAETCDLRVYLKTVEGQTESWLPPRPDDIVVWAKSDITAPPEGMVPVSGKTGQGIDHLLGLIELRLRDRLPGSTVMTRERHRIAALTAIRALESARIEVATGRAELAADFLRQGARALDMLVGRVDVEALLGEIFASFCIGK